MTSLRDDSPLARTALYLRLLYSPRQAEAFRRELEEAPDGMPPATAALLRTVDFTRLAIEQSARARNLLFRLKELSPSLFRIFANDSDLAMVSSFCDSDDFWEPKGRTLLESFCLFAAGRLSGAGGETDAALARLWGVMSGLQAAPASASPWSNASLRHNPAPDVHVEERFVSRWPLLTTEGTVVEANALREMAPRDRAYAIGVACGSDGIVVTSEAIERRP